MLWHIGNTTVRTPYRLRGALIALQGSPLLGNLIGADKETEFAKLLHAADVVNVQRIEGGGEDDFSDLGRKWRSALSQLGFITHKFDRKTLSGEIDPRLVPATAGIAELSGRPYEITPSGYRLISTDVVAGQQEAFLRSLLGYKIPSPIEPKYKCAPFSPLKYVIDILFVISGRGQEVYISFEEYALFVQTSTPDDDIEAVTDSILDFRARRRANQGSVRPFDRAEYRLAALRNDPAVQGAQLVTKTRTLDDYADLSLRYLKATGLFRSKGRGISISPIKEELVLLIHESEDVVLSDTDYLINLWNGAALPTDNIPEAEKVIINLTAKIEAKGGAVAAVVPGEDLSQKRHTLEQQLSRLEEQEYYRNQAGQADEIIAWLKALSGGVGTLPDGERVIIPRAEGPAYFEWAIWRAFLAINSLVNMPWEARRFQIDQDFLPVGTAPGNGPDMVFEFADSILVVEVTLTSSSRQEAAEGEPVRRHVAKYSEAQGAAGKSVYGLFIAVNIDSNTAHTFRTGDWYLRDDSKINLQIVPLKLADFEKLFSSGKDNLNVMLGKLQTVLLRCRAQANQEAPIWKQSISTIIDQSIAQNINH